MLKKIKGKTALDWVNIGDSFIKSGNFQKAIECCEKAVKIDPQNEDAWYNMGWAYGGLGNYQKAEECFDKAGNRGYIAKKLLFS